MIKKFFLALSFLFLNSFAMQMPEWLEKATIVYIKTVNSNFEPIHIKNDTTGSDIKKEAERMFNISFDRQYIYPFTIHNGYTAVTRQALENSENIKQIMSSSNTDRFLLLTSYIKGHPKG